MHTITIIGGTIAALTIAIVASQPSPHNDPLGTAPGAPIATTSASESAVVDVHMLTEEASIPAPALGTSEAIEPFAGTHPVERVSEPVPAPVTAPDALSAPVDQMTGPVPLDESSSNATEGASSTFTGPQEGASSHVTTPTEGEGASSHVTPANPENDEGSSSHVTPSNPVNKGFTPPGNQVPDLHLLGYAGLPGWAEFSLVWSHVNGAAHYEVLNADSGELLVVVDADSPRWDSTVTQNTRLEVVAVAPNGDRTSASNVVDIAVTDAFNQVPQVKVDSRAGLPGWTEFSLVWTIVNSATSYEVRNADTGEVLDVVGADSPMWDSTVTQNTRIEVVAIWGDGKRSQASEAVSIRVNAGN